MSDESKCPRPGWGFRIPFLLALIFVGWLSGSQFRTSVFGGNLAVALALDAFGWLILGFGACPVMTVCGVLGLPWKQGVIIFCTVGIVTILAIEAFARAQEYIVINTYGKNPSQEVWVTRWKPFTGNGMHYIPGQGRWFGHE